MFNIDFFKSCHGLKKDIMNGRLADGETIYRTIDKLRSRIPFVFNIETTNACNMKCVMCPRTRLMKRPVRHMDMKLFEKIIDQIKPHKKEDLKNFWNFIVKSYGITPEERSENAFYFYTVSRMVILHGYGEPLLDPYIKERVRLCSSRNIPTYFSCVPANIDVEKVTELMRSGLGVIKFAIDALEDEGQKKVRGERNDFTKSYEKILKLLEIKRVYSEIKTSIVVTMLEMSRDEKSKTMYNDFMDLWKDKDVFAYIKSQDNRWLYEEEPGLECKAHYESQYCEYPWTSLSIMAEGNVVPCTQDYNCEMVMGDANRESLEEIWNSTAYENFRKWHITGDFPKHYKCVARCDQKKVFNKVKHGEKNEKYV